MANPAAGAKPLHVRFGEFELDEANARLRHGETPIALAPTPFGLLCALLRHRGALLTKHALLDEVWGHRFVSDSVLKGRSATSAQCSATMSNVPGSSKPFPVAVIGSSHF